MEARALKIDGISRLDLDDTQFRVNNDSFNYESIESISFTATVTRHSVNFIPTGKTYEASLTLKIAGRWITIEPDKGWLGRLRKGGFEAIQRAYGALAAISFTQRVERHEAHLADRGFFDIAGFQFHRDGHVFENGRELCSLRDPNVSLHLAPFELTLRRKSRSMADRFRSAFSGSKETRIPLTTDRDCALYMLKSVFGITFPGSPAPEKQVDRRKVFYHAVLRFGACLAKADGVADPAELAQLKRFFHLDDQHIAGAARIFNEALATPTRLPDILGAFAAEFRDATEVKEGFLLGMLSVAVTDGDFHPYEYALIKEAAAFLGLPPASFTRIMLSAGLDPEGFATGDGGSRRNADDGRRPPPSGRAVHLRVLGLTTGANPEEIQRAYRALVRRYHPDVLRGQGMPDDEIEKASQVLAQINIAYEALLRAA